MNPFTLFCLALFAASGRVDAVITTDYLAANGLNFTCTILKHTSEDPDAPVKEIMMLHGFPMFRVWWDPLLKYWDDLLMNAEEIASESRAGGYDDMSLANVSVHAVACDLRGYSPGASPNSIEEYDYSIFADDAFALAKASGFEDGFHLLGHDHGAGLAWYIAGNDPDNLILSLTTLSVPHIDLLSESLCGENTDEGQVIASNYFNQFSLADSATRNNASLTTFFQSFGMPIEPIQLQKMMWWYNGSLATHFSLPRVVSDDEVDEFQATYGQANSFFIQGSRAAIPLEEKPCVAVQGGISAIEVPTLFICGLGDFALLCNNPYVTEYPSELLPNYEHANFECGHDFFLEGNCANMNESVAVMDKITAFVLGAGETATDEPEPTQGEETPSTDDTSSTNGVGDGGENVGETATDSIEEDTSSDNSLIGKPTLLLAWGGTVFASLSLIF